MNQSAQASLEYLFTYGWAFFAVILAISALLYFGLLDFNSLKSSECQFTPGVICQDFIVTDDFGGDEVQIIILNTYGVELEILNVTATSPITNTIPCMMNETDWQIEETLLLSCDIPPDLYEDDLYYDFSLKIQFRQPSHTFVHNTSARLSTFAQ